MIRIYKTGRHAMRTPLSYAALQPLFEGAVELVERPEQADLYLFAHELDIKDAPEAMIADWQRRKRPIVLLSEEPFWETIWLQNPIDRAVVIETRFGALPVIQLNHHTSGIFDFEQIPYYLLTNHRFSTSYAYRFTRNAARSASEWQERFAARQVDLTFMFERRPEPYHAVRWPEGDVIGLCSWRTEMAEACQAGRVERLGQSWQGGKTRFELKNWHLDKLVSLDDHAHKLAAFENTHQPGYLTEKLFDAFACGSMPLYFASPEHSVHRLGLTPGSWLNLFDLKPEAAVAQIEGARMDADFFAAFHASQLRLKELFTDPALLVRERARLRHALLEELRLVLDQPG